MTLTERPNSFYKVQLTSSASSIIDEMVSQCDDKNRVFRMNRSSSNGNPMLKGNPESLVSSAANVSARKGAGGVEHGVAQPRPSNSVCPRQSPPPSHVLLTSLEGFTDVVASQQAESQPMPVLSYSNAVKTILSKPPPQAIVAATFKNSPRPLSAGISMLSDNACPSSTASHSVVAMRPRSSSGKRSINLVSKTVLSADNAKGHSGAAMRPRSSSGKRSVEILSKIIPATDGAKGHSGGEARPRSSSGKRSVDLISKTIPATDDTKRGLVRDSITESGGVRIKKRGKKKKNRPENSDCALPSAAANEPVERVDVGKVLLFDDDNEFPVLLSADQKSWTGSGLCFVGPAKFSDIVTGRAVSCHHSVSPI